MRRLVHRACVVAALLALSSAGAVALTDMDDAPEAEPVEAALPPPPGAPARQDNLCARLDALLGESADTPERRQAAATRAAIHCAATGSSVKPHRDGADAK